MTNELSRICDYCGSPLFADGNCWPCAFSPRLVDVRDATEPSRMSDARKSGAGNLIENPCTPEMIEAGALALSPTPCSNAEYLTAIYTAMKALDPEVERVREALLAVKAYYFDANPTGLSEARVCDLVCGALFAGEQS